MSGAQHSSLLAVKERLASARSVVVLTGAGISADSGVPTFRGRDGLWRNFRAEDLATPEAFARDPKVVWEWYDWRRQLIRTKSPNPAHHALVDIERRVDRFTLITQNVDGLHGAAGSEQLIELHGNIWKVRCTKCRMVSYNTEVPIRILPYCAGCGGLLRPHIVWFGEALNPLDLTQSEQALQSCELLLIIGTSGVVYPAGGFASVACAAGAFVAEVNLDPATNSSRGHVCLAGHAKDLVPLLL
jgi:NAD-dependent deacetylase